MANLNPFNLDGARVNAPFAPGYSRGTRVTAPNGHYLDFASDVTWGLFADGMPWFINDGVALTARYPAGRVYSSNDIDGYTLNPTLNGSQGLDERRAGYVAPAAINTITPRKMDVILSVESEETTSIGGGNAWRDGYFKTHGQAWFTCLTKPPSATTFSPTVHWPGDDVNRLNRPMREVDIDGMLSRLPSYSASGITSPPAWSSFANSWDQPSAAWLHNAYFAGGIIVDAAGFGGGMPRGFSGTINDNWGGHVVDELSRLMNACILDHWSPADKRAFLIRLCQHGNQWIEPFAGLPARTIVADGGQVQWHWPAIAAWLDATGQNARSDNLLGIFKGNYEGVFAATASMIANDFVRHTSDTKPFPWRDRNVSLASGTNLTLQAFTAGDNLADGPNPTFLNLQANRVGGGGPIRITAWDFDNYIATAQSQPAPVWATSDTVYFTPGFTITEGSLHWALKGPNQMNLFNPSPDANYFFAQTWAAQVLFLRSMGIVAPIFENAADFVALCAAGNYPAAAPYAYPDHRKTTLDTQVWNAHFATASAVPSRPGF
jgi:hypothetical protein